jgi:hypothetical protein
VLTGLPVPSLFLLAVWLLRLGLWRRCLPHLLTMMMMLLVRVLVLSQIVGTQA